MFHVMIIPALLRDSNVLTSYSLKVRYNSTQTLKQGSTDVVDLPRINVQLVFCTTFHHSPWSSLIHHVKAQNSRSNVQPNPHSNLRFITTLTSFYLHCLLSQSCARWTFNVFALLASIIQLSKYSHMGAFFRYLVIAHRHSWRDFGKSSQ